MKGLQEVSDMITSLVEPGWENIKCVTSKEWEEDFNNYLNNILDTKTIPKSSKARAKSKKIKKPSVDKLDEDRQFELCCGLFSLMEGVWLEGKKRMSAIEQTRISEPLDLDEVIDYSYRIRSTTYSPPENMNVDDPTRHYDMFRQYHFLGVPNTTQMHMSRLFSLSKLENQCSPPVVSFEVISGDMKRMKIVCKTPNSVIHFQTSRESNIPCPRTGNYITYTTDPAVYDCNKSYKFNKDCNPFTVHAWSTCDGMRQSAVVNVKYESDVKLKVEEKKDDFDLMLSRKK